MGRQSVKRTGWCTGCNSSQHFLNGCPRAPTVDAWYIRATGRRKGLELALVWLVGSEKVHYTIVRLGNIATDGPEPSRVRYITGRQSVSLGDTFLRTWRLVPNAKLRGLALATEVARRQAATNREKHRGQPAAALLDAGMTFPMQELENVQRAFLAELGVQL